MCDQGQSLDCHEVCLEILSRSTARSEVSVCLMPELCLHHYRHRLSLSCFPLGQPTHPAASAGWPSPRHFVQWKSPLALVLIVFKIPSWLRYLIREPCSEPGCWKKIRAGGWTIPTSQSKAPHPDLHKSLSRLEKLSSKLPGTASKLWPSLSLD